jgi:hypothetical protein
VLRSDYEIINDGGRRRRWSSSEKLRIVEETLDEIASISVVARRNGVAPNLDLSRFDAAPLIAFIATKETDYGTETDGRISARCS